MTGDFDVFLRLEKKYLIQIQIKYYEWGKSVNGGNDSYKFFLSQHIWLEDLYYLSLLKDNSLSVLHWNDMEVMAI